jgi:RND family efflux transporter MFP subunit
MTNPHGRPPLSRREKFALAVASIVLLALAGASAAYMMNNRPKPKRKKPTPSAQIVTVQNIKSTTRQVTVPVMGTVVPAVEVDLKSRVTGEIIWINPEFVEGGIVKKGQTLVKIDPTEYELALLRKKATIQSAMLELRTEEGRQEIARSEWAILGLEENATELDRDLALRQPQLAANRANLEAARAEIKQAELDLERTVIKAPFNAIIRSANVDVGAQATNQGTLASLVGSDRFYIETLIPMDRIKWIHIPDKTGDAGSTAKIVSGSGRTLKGRIYKLLGEIEPNGRLARLLVEIKDPLDLARVNGDRHPLLLNDYVSVEIEGRSVQNVFVIERQHLDDGNLVYLVDDDDRLQIRTVDIVWSSADHVLARGLKENEKLIISDVPAPVEGMKLRVTQDQEPGHGDAETR